MSSRGEACEAARLIVKIAKPVRGGHRAYTPGHIVDALEILSRSPAGRPQLSRALGLGEASTKTLISLLEGYGLVERTGRGRALTPRGMRLLEAIRRAIILVELPHSFFGRSSGDIAAVTPLIPPATDLTRVYAYRDFLVEYHCRTALIGGIVNNRVVLPGAPEHVTDRARVLLPQAPDGLLIVVPSTCRVALVSAILAMLVSGCHYVTTE